MRLSTAAIIVASLALGCCDDEGVPSVSIGRYAYTAYDSSGTAVAQGWLDVRGTESSSLTGIWHIDAVGSPADIGPQTGDGVLTGFVSSGQLTIELNPTYRDNNVGLIGTLQGSTFAGTWTYTGFPGVINAGTFTATQRPE